MSRSFQSQKRGHETPMDWEWQTQAPTDPQSPFPQFKAQHGYKATFESPPKPTSSFISTSNNSAPAPAFRNPSFTTPRKAFDQDLFSEVSGAESSPADNADEDTPDITKTAQTMTAFNIGTVKQPIFGKYGAGFLGSSPGRAERARGKYGNAISHKLRKRKRAERDYALTRTQRDLSDSDSDGAESRPRSREKKAKHEATQNIFASFFSFIHNHPNLPNIMSYYAQFAVNAAIASFVIYVIYSFVQTVRGDINKAADDEKMMIMAGMAVCTREFLDNKCASNARMPALQKMCDEWEECMNKDPDSIARARVSAATFAEIFNSFIEPISYKAMFFVSLIVIAAVLVNNLAFGALRKNVAHMPSDQHYYQQPPPQNFQWSQPPQTPRHNTEYDAFNGQAYQAIMPSHTPGQMSSSKTRSPSKTNRSPSKGSLY